MSNLHPTFAQIMGDVLGVDSAPECWMCGTTHDLRVLGDDTYTDIPDLTCEDCCPVMEDGPHFDDLEEVPCAA